MLMVTIEFHPFGDTSKKKTLGRLRIVNDGTGDPEIGNYDVALSRPGRDDDRFLKARVEGYRRQEHDAFELLNLALDALLPRDRPQQPLDISTLSEDERITLAESLLETGLIGWDNDLEFALTCGAFRYALGRRSYGVSCVIDALRPILKTCRTGSLDRMVKEIDEAIAGDLAGDQCDVDSWARLREDIAAEIKRRRADS